MLDGSAYSLIDRITSSSSGSPLTDVQYQAPLVQAILDTHLGMGRGGSASISFGTVVDNTNNTNRGGVSIATGSTYNVSIPLMLTAIDATFTNKMIPIGKVSDLQLQFFMASVGNSVQTASTTANWKLTNFSLVVDFLELDAGAMAELDRKSDGGIIQYSGEIWRGYQFALNAGSSADTIVVPAKMQSCKTLYSTFRYTQNVNNSVACSTVARMNPFINGATFYANIGATAVPQVPLRNAGQFFIELIKAQHGLYEPIAYTNQFNATNWVVCDQTASDTATSVGSFLLGLDLENFNGKGDVVYSGASIVGGTVLSLVQAYGTPLALAVTQNVYLQADAVVSIVNGQMSLVY